MIVIECSVLVVDLMG